MKRIRVPEEMIEASISGFSWRRELRMEDQIRATLEKALLWLSENPQVPTDEQCDELLHSFALDGEARTGGPVNRRQVKCIAMAWQRRCFVQEEPEFWSQERVEKELEKATQIWDDVFAQMMKKLVIEHYMKPAQIEFVGPEGIIPQDAECVVKEKSSLKGPCDICKRELPYLEMRRASESSLDLICETCAELSSMIGKNKEPSIPAEIEDLMWGSGSKNAEDDACHNRDVVEAFRRGREGK